jgi:uncharacterized membrane protein (DUF106 family)
VTVEWLEKAVAEGWITITGNTGAFSPDIDVAAPISPLVIGGGVVIVIIVIAVIIGIIVAVISIRKKKADYKLALEKHKTGMARLKQNIASDLLKDQ